MSIHNQNGRDEHNETASEVLKEETTGRFTDTRDSADDYTTLPDELRAAGSRDIYPRTPVATLKRNFSEQDLSILFDIDVIAALTGMAVSYINRALGNRDPQVTLKEVLFLLDLDAFSETFVPRSRVPEYLLNHCSEQITSSTLPASYQLVKGSAKDLIASLPHGSVQCVVTSTPYWGTRTYSEYFDVSWADGEVCPFGHEQTPEGFIRHTIELLYLLKPAMTLNGSVWWNLMDTYNTRTQIRENAAETLRAMQGHDRRSWRNYACRRYSAGHSFLKDGEQCLIPQRVAERASRIGYWIKSMITWKKINSMPETVSSRVTREIEYIIHLSIQRTPFFNKSAYHWLPPSLGGRDPRFEAEKITDIWYLPTTAGQGGHGAQFPIALPGRCIGLSTQESDLVVDPFVGAGTTLIAATRLKRRSLGFDVSELYLDIAHKKISDEINRLSSEQNTEQLRLV